MDTVGYDIFPMFRDLFLSQEERDNMVYTSKDLCGKESLKYPPTFRLNHIGLMFSVSIHDVDPRINLTNRV